MFDLKGFFKALSFPLLYALIIGFFFGLIDIGSIPLMIFLLFIPTYVGIGLLAPLWNHKVPYFASYLTALTFSSINIVVGEYIFNFDLLTNAEGINRSLIYSTSLALLTTYLFIRVKKSRSEKGIHNA